MTQLQAISKEIELSGSRRFPHYSDTEPTAIRFVDRVPSHWRTEKLKHVASVSFSSVDKKTEEDETPVRLCNYTDVYSGDRIVDDPDFMAATASPDEIARFTLLKGDVLITKDSESWNDIAVPAYVTADMPGVLCGYHLAHIRPNSAKLDGAFLSRAFSADGIRQQFHIAANGITRFGLPNRAIAGALFPIPPLDEQRTIAAYLDSKTLKIDELIAKKTRLIVRINDMRTACIEQAITRGIVPSAKLTSTNYEWAPQAPVHWKFMPIRRLLNNLEQGWSPTADQRTAEAEEWGVLKVGAVYRGKFRPEENKAFPSGLEPESRFEVKEGDLLVTRGNTPELVADACVVPAVRGRLMLSDLHYRLALDERRMDKEFACYWLLSRAGRHQIEADAHGTSNSMVKISQSQIKTWVFAVPPLAEQKAIVSYLDKQLQQLDELVQKVTRAIARLKGYRSALISTVITGQIDVRNYRPEALCP